jgi:hypothetical protein
MRPLLHCLPKLPGACQGSPTCRSAGSCQNSGQLDCLSLSAELLLNPHMGPPAPAFLPAAGAASAYDHACCTCPQDTQVLLLMVLLLLPGQPQQLRHYTGTAVFRANPFRWTNFTAKVVPTEPNTCRQCAQSQPRSREVPIGRRTSYKHKYVHFINAVRTSDRQTRTHTPKNDPRTWRGPKISIVENVCWDAAG